MIIQEEKVEIVEDNNNLQKSETVTEPVSKKSIFVYIALFVGILFLILLIIFGAFTFYNISNSDTIAKGVYINNIDVSGLNKNQALTKISKNFEDLQTKDIKLVTEGYETYINPTEINLKYDINSAITYAFSIGKSGNIFTDDYDALKSMINGTNIIPKYVLDEEALKSTLDKISAELPNAVVESSYYIEDSTLIITKGTDGYAVNIDKTFLDIKSKLADLSFVTSPTQISEIKSSPKEVNLDEIYKEVHKDATDAYFTTNPYAVYPSSTGIDFKISLDEAKKELAKSDKECKIALKTLYPKVTTNMLGKEAFPNLLAEYKTYYNSSQTNRTTNLRLAAQKINGIVLLPGETFSYNKTVGERTISAGFKEAGVYVNGDLVDGLGGGICQVSSTIFNAVLLSNLKIEEVYYHPYVSSYVPIGRDATVAYGSKDFRFTNSRDYAIKIECTVSGGVARCKIYGKKQDPEYDVKISTKINSQTATYTKTTTYRSLYLNGKHVSTERIYNCTYKKH